MKKRLLLSLLALGLCASAHARVEVGTNSGILWGINGHVGRGPYAEDTLQTQMAKAASLGVRHYRTDFYWYDDADIKLLRHIIAVANQYDIQVTPVLIPSTPTYDYAKAMASTFARAFPNIQVWELDNEASQQVVNTNIDKITGAPEQYSSNPRYHGVKEKIRGLIDGLREGNPTAKAAVGDQGGCTYAFLVALWRDGLRWDITVTHPYDFWEQIDDITKPTGNRNCDQGPSDEHATTAEMSSFIAAGGAKQLKQNPIGVRWAFFRKPIWLTEFNRTAAVHNRDKTGMGRDDVAMMQKFVSIAKLYHIELASLYELFDEPNVDGGDANDEAHFGIFNADRSNSPASDAITAYIKTQPSVDYDLDGYTSLKSKVSSLCMNISGESIANGANILQFPCQRPLNELFSFRKIGSGYQLKVKHSQKCMTPSGNSIVQTDCSKDPNNNALQWTILPNDDDGTVTFQSTQNGLCIEVPNNSTASSVALTFNTCFRTPNQRFTLPELPPKK